MAQDYKNLIWSLKKLLDIELDEYKREILKLGKEEIFELASEIIAAREVHTEMCFWLELSMHQGEWPCILPNGPISEQELQKLLALGNPLKVLANKWWFCSIGNKLNFGEFYKSVVQVSLLQKQCL
jgi:hypothetical protein